MPGLPRAYPAPHWLTWLIVAGLALVYTGERILAAAPVARAIASGAGVLIVVGAAGWRLVAWRRAPADARGTEGLFVLMYAGCVLALALFFLAGAGTTWLGIDFAEPASETRFTTSLTVIASIVLALSLLSALAAHWAAGPANQRDETPGAVDRLRITQVAAAALVVAMAGAMLMLTGFVAARRDKTLDVSYFRTASPGGAVRQIAETMSSPLRVILFFPPASEVNDQVTGYFRALASVEAVQIEEHDRLASPQLAEEYRVTDDGTIVLVAGDRSERITLPVDMRNARRRLRGLDEEVRRSLMRVAREERTIYLTVGHGELNDPRSVGPLDAMPFRSIRGLRNLFQLLNYRVQDLGVQSGLGNAVPGDAAMVLVLGPQRPFLEPELESLRRYLDNGGSLLLALEPGSGFDMGPLRERLGVEFHDVPLADDQQHLRQRGNLSDRRLIVTDRFTSHAAVSTVSRGGVGAGILLMGAGYLEPYGDSRRANFVVRSLPSTFADLDQTFEFDEAAEERKSYSLVAAIEDEPAGGGEDAGSEGGGMRALVLADAELFSDAVISSLGMNAALAADAITWLGREEERSGETVSEEDVPIVHTRAQDVAWFYSTILGAPALVLLFGLVGVRRRRRGTRRASDSPATARAHAVDEAASTVELVASGSGESVDEESRQGETP